jgi:hypothetical protein
MKTNGSVYVAAVFAALFGYFGYQWWFNPARAVKQRLGQVAAALSVPETESDIARVARLAQLRRYLADDLHIRAGAEEIRSRDAAIAAAAAWKPQPGSGDVHFADVQVFIESDTAAHAYLAVELTSMDRESGHPTVDSRDASVGLAKRGGEWVITTAESKELPGPSTRLRADRP